MKNKIKIYSLFILLIVLGYSCEDGVNSFEDTPTNGWIEFTNAQTTTGQTSSSITVPLAVNVPVYSNGLNISYNIVGVEGDYTNFVASSSGSTFADPTADNRSANIEVNLMNMEVGRDFVTSFDIVLTSVDVDGVNIGVDENSVTAHRVTIPCSNPEIVSNDYFVGDYVIVDVSGVIGPGNGTENFASGTVTLIVDPTNPNKRIFSVGALPAFNGEIETVTIEFSTDNVVLLGNVDPTLSCGGGVPYIFSNAGIGNSSPWDICNDQFITIVYSEDPNGSCGGPFLSSFSLTKL